MDGKWAVLLTGNMKNPVLSFVLLSAAAGIGFSASHFKAEKERAELDRQVIALKTLHHEHEEKETQLIEMHQVEIKQLHEELDATGSQLAMAGEELKQITKERDELKRQIAFSKKPAGRTAGNETEPISVDTDPEETEAIKPGTLDLPPGFSKGGGQIKRPGE